MKRDDKLYFDSQFESLSHAFDVLDHGINLFPISKVPKIKKMLEEQNKKMQNIIDQIDHMVQEHVHEWGEGKFHKYCILDGCLTIKNSETGILESISYVDFVENEK